MYLPNIFSKLSERWATVEILDFLRAVQIVTRIVVLSHTHIMSNTINLEAFVTSMHSHCIILN